MDERRRNKRLELSSRILIKRLGQNVAEEVHIDISDVSKTGVGFTCSTRLEVGAVYESFLTIWTSEVLHTFLEVVRISRRGDIYEYGAIFIGMSEMDASRIETYGTIQDMGM
jgi:hypothetical protein